MTPFDAQALLVMLLPFYPTPSAAALAQARAERPEYFAGGTLTGSKGDKLALPDGRVFDLIFAAGGLPGDQRWQVLDVTGDSGGDGWTLTPGPLAPIDLAVLPMPAPVATFEPMVAAALGELGDVDATLANAATGVTANLDPNEIDNGYESTVSPAAQAVSEQLDTVHILDPSELLDASGQLGGTIDAERSEFPAPAEAPGDVPVGDPRRPPVPEGEGDERRPWISTE